MNVFDFRNRLVRDYSAYTRGFITIRDPRLDRYVHDQLESGVLWPEPLIQLNPSFEMGDSIDELVARGALHPECSGIFRRKSDRASRGDDLRLHRHQSEAIQVAQTGLPYVLTTGTGSGKSLAYIVPAVNHVLRRGTGGGIQAIVVYPMNALANSQKGELQKFLCHGYSDGPKVTFERYTGQERPTDRRRIQEQPPDILLTNYVMLELLLTRPEERRPLVKAAHGLQFLVLDELHSYRGRQGADVAMLVRRVRDALGAPRLQCVGTSATLAGSDNLAEQRRQVAAVAGQLFGTTVLPEHVIGETLRRITPARELHDPAFVAELTTRIQNESHRPPSDFPGFVNDPLSIWLESTLGVRPDSSGNRLIRARSCAILGESGAANQLAQMTGLPVGRCVAAIQEGLQGAYSCEPNPETQRPPFAFRLHQFISRGDSAYASIEDEATRYPTIQGQRFVPNDREKALLPLVFCRECGQAYYCVRLSTDRSSGEPVYIPRDLSDRSDAEGQPGYLHFSAANPWPDPDDVAFLGRLPDDWVEEFRAGERVKKSQEKRLPARH